MTELIQAPDRWREPEALFRLAGLISEVPLVFREHWLGSCLDVVELKRGDCVASSDGCDLTTLVGALPAAAQVELTAAIERIWTWGAER